MRMFLCPHCHALEEYVMHETHEIWFTPYYLEDDEHGDPEYSDTEYTAYLCPECENEVNPDDWFVEVDLDHDIFAIPAGSRWNEMIEEAIEAMREHGYDYVDEDEDEYDDEDEYEDWNIQGHDIFINEEEVWKV